MVQGKPKRPGKARGSLGQLLTAYRIRAGYTQQQVAELIDAKATQVSAWESERKHVQPWALDLLAFIYRLPNADTFTLFTAAGYSPQSDPSILQDVREAYAHLRSPVLQVAAVHLLNGAIALIESWESYDQQVGPDVPPKPRRTKRDVDLYWNSTGRERRHNRRID